MKDVLPDMSIIRHGPPSFLKTQHVLKIERSTRKKVKSISSVTVASPLLGFASQSSVSPSLNRRTRPEMAVVP